MPNIGFYDLITLLIVLTVLVGGIFLLVRVIGRSQQPGQDQRVRDLEKRVRDLENP